MGGDAPTTDLVSVACPRLSCALLIRCVVLPMSGKFNLADSHFTRSNARRSTFDLRHLVLAPYLKIPTLTVHYNE